MQYHLDDNLWKVVPHTFLGTTYTILDKTSEPYYYNFPANFDFLVDTIVLNRLEYTCNNDLGHNIEVELI